MDKPAFRTALSDFSPIPGNHTLSELPLCGKINIRGNAKDKLFRREIKSALGIKLPRQANTVSTNADHSLFWLGPDEWLLHLPLESLADTLKTLRSALANQHAAITDVSDYFSVIELAGEYAREIIASASPFDTRAINFPVGSCAQTRFGQASILLWPLKDAAAFGIQVRWSYAQYVYAYLAQSIENAEQLSIFQQHP